MASRSFLYASNFTKRPIVGPAFRASTRCLHDLPASTSTSVMDTQPLKTTHFKITLRRSAISLGDRIKGTLEALGIHRRMQTVYHPHNPETAGKILAVKELVEVENVPEHLVRSKQQQTLDRKAKRGYKVVGSRRPIL